MFAVQSQNHCLFNVKKYVTLLNKSLLLLLLFLLKLA